jgi:hypothetical protein
MFNQRQKSGQDVIDRLMPAEKALDEAISYWSDLASELPKARLAMGVAAEVGHEAMAAATATISLLIQARTTMLATHRELAKDRTRLDLDIVDFGGLMPKPANGALRMRALRAA